MKKHVFGLLIFGFIVSAAAIVYGVFNVSNVEEVFVITSGEAYPEVKSCWRMSKELKDSNVGSVKVNQAVLNLQTKQFYWEVFAPNSYEPIDVHIFSKDESGIRYIDTQRIYSGISHNGKYSSINSYEWTNKLKSFENLYVIARTASESKNYLENFQVYGNKYQPKFDATKATAVTISYGE